VKIEERAEVKALVEEFRSLENEAYCQLNFFASTLPFYAFFEDSKTEQNLEVRSRSRGQKNQARTKTSL
jgi:hypothetical protein